MLSLTAFWRIVGLQSVQTKPKVLSICTRRQCEIFCTKIERGTQLQDSSQPVGKSKYIRCGRPHRKSLTSVFPLFYARQTVDAMAFPRIKSALYPISVYETPDAMLVVGTHPDSRPAPRFSIMRVSRNAPTEPEHLELSLTDGGHTLSQRELDAVLEREWSSSSNGTCEDKAVDKVRGEAFPLHLLADLLNVLPPMAV